MERSIRAHGPSAGTHREKVAIMYPSHLPAGQRRIAFLALLGVVFVAEALAMLLLDWLFPGLSGSWLGILADALILVIISAPFVWWLMVQPLKVALRNEYRFAHALVNNPATLVMVLDRHWHIVWFNPGCVEATGYPADEAIGKDVFDLLVPADEQERAREVLASCFQGNSSLRHLMTIQRQDGSSFWVEWNHELLRDEQGASEYIVVHGFDITDQRRQEQQLRESEARFRLLFDSADDAIFVYPVAMGHFVDVNAAACRLLGYTRKQLLTLGPREVCSGLEFGQVVAELAQHGAARLERTLIGREGREILVEIAVRRFDLNGVPHHITIARDIGSQKRTELRLQESEARLRALIESIGQSAILMALDGTILEHNTVAADRMGLRQEDMIGQNIFSAMSPGIAKMRREQIALMAEDPHPVSYEESYNGMRLRHTVVPVAATSGPALQLAVLSEDITESSLLRHIDGLMHGLDLAVLHGADLMELLAFASDQLVKRFGFDVVWVGQKQADGRVDALQVAGERGDYVEAIMRTGVRWDESPRGRGPTGTAIRSGMPRMVRTAEAGATPWALSGECRDIGSILAMPLMAQGVVFGALTLCAHDPEAFSKDRVVPLLEQIGDRLNILIDMAEQQQQMRQLHTAVETAGSGMMVLSRDGAIEWTNHALRKMTGYDNSELLGMTPRVFKSGLHAPDYYKRLWQTLLSGQTWREETINRRKDGSLFTVMQIAAPVRDSRGRISHFISVLEDISERKRAEAHIRYMAEHDALTDLPNRVLMRKRLRDYLSEKRRPLSSLGLLYLDIDRFKAINDQYGHDVGDALLQGFAKRLLAAVRAEDTVARIGGDEFIILLPRLSGPDGGEIVARKILAGLELPIECLGQSLRVGSSIGVVHVNAGNVDPDFLLKCADMAMYQAKEAGRNTWRVYDGSLDGGVEPPPNGSRSGAPT